MERFGLPANFTPSKAGGGSGPLPALTQKSRSSSLSSLPTTNNASAGSSSRSSFLGSLNLPKRALSYNQLSHVPSLSSIKEEEKHLKWGFVEEFVWNSDVDSKSSSRQSGEEEEEDFDTEDYAHDDDEEGVGQGEEEEEEEDGWGWFAEEEKAAGPKQQQQPISPSSAATAALAKLRTFSEGDEPRASSPATGKASPPSPPVARKRKSILRAFGEPIPLEPMDPPLVPPQSQGAPNQSLLILGTKHWPQRQSKRPRRVSGGGILTHAVNSYATAKNPTMFDPTATTQTPGLDSRISLMQALVQEARSKGYPLPISALLIFLRGMGTGYAIRAVPNAFFRLVSWFYSTRVSSNHGESLRTALFLGTTMAVIHVFALTNSPLEEDVDEEEDEEDEENEEDQPNALAKAVKVVPWVPIAALVMTPLLALLPYKSRLSMALFLAARASEAAINGLLARLSPALRAQIPISSWLFSLGIAQITFSWLFHRQALPTNLALFLDQANSFKMDLSSASLDNLIKTLRSAAAEQREPLIKRIMFGSGLFEFIASDVFSAASLFGPLFDIKSPALLLNALRCARVALVLVLSAIFTRVGVVALSRLLHRFSPINGFWAGFISGLVAIQFEPEDGRRIELAMFALTFASRTLFNLAGQRNIVPQTVPMGEFALYFAALLAVLTATTNRAVVAAALPAKNKLGGSKPSPAPRLLLGATFRTLIRRCIIP